MGAEAKALAAAEAEAKTFAAAEAEAKALAQFEAEETPKAQVEWSDSALKGFLVAEEAPEAQVASRSRRRVRWKSPVAEFTIMPNRNETHRDVETWICLSTDHFWELF